MKSIFESHAHYEDEAFNEDREALLASLPENGIEYVVNVGSTVDTCYKTVDLVKQYSHVYGALGVHPSEIRTATAKDLEWIREEAKNNPKILAIGEIGLDYYWDKDNREQQMDYFKRQIAIAKEIEKPIIVHSRDAAKDTYDCMTENDAAKCGGVVHCFSYGPEEAAKYLKMGFYIGIGGVVTFKNAVKIREVVEAVPLDRILLETDCPYLAPEPYRGKRNSSLYIPHIVEKIAEIKKTDCEEVLSVTFDNACKMYRIGQKG